MPRAVTLTFDDGSQHVYNGVPDDASPDAVIARAGSEFPGKKLKGVDGGSAAPKQMQPPEDLTFMERNVAPALEKVGNAIQSAKPLMPAPMRVAANLDRNSPVVQAMADPGTSIAQLIGNLFGQGDKVNPAIRANEAQYQASRGADAGTMDPARIATNVFNPLTWSGVSAIPRAASMVGRAAQGAGVGAGFGAATPVTEGDSFWGHKAAQVGGGAFAGGTIPLLSDGVQKLVSGLYHIIEPHLPGGIQRVAGRTANTAAGSRQADVVDALENSRSLVPGSNPTAGEAAVPAGSTEFAGLQRIVRDILPSDYRARSEAQEGARRAAVGGIAKTPADLAAAVTDRKSITDPMYQAARSGGPVNTESALAEVNDLLQRNPGNRELVTELSNIRSGLLGERGVPRTDPEQVISVIDGIKASLANENNKFIGGTVANVRESIKDAVPGMRSADQAFADASAPINRMQVGSYLGNKLSSPLNDAERPAMFATAIRDALSTLKRSTGQPRFTELGQVLTPGENNTVQGVVSDLARKADFEKMAQQGLPAARKTVQGIDPIQLPNALHRPIMIINAILKRVQGGAEGRSLEELSRLMQNPQEMAAVMRAASPGERFELARTLGMKAVNPAIGAVSTAAAEKQ